MIKSFRGTVLLLAAILALGVTFSVKADLLFENSQTDLAYRLNPGLSEVGDQIILSSGGMALTNFSFEFYGVNTASTTTFAGNVEAQVKFYQMNGTPFNGIATPGTELWSSGWFSMNNLTGPTARNTLVFTTADFGTLILPNELTWSVQFRNLGATDELGVDIYSPPTVGQDYADYWRLDSVRGWVLETNIVAMDFAAILQGTAVVPEPSSVTLSIVGGLGLFFASRRIVRKA
jgi:hypothetical protein